MKEVRDIYAVNYNTLIKVTEDDSKKYKDIPCSWTGRINIVKTAMLPKATYRFNAIPYQNTYSILHRSRTNNPKIYTETQKTQSRQSNP